MFALACLTRYEAWPVTAAALAAAVVGTLAAGDASPRVPPDGGGDRRVPGDRDRRRSRSSAAS